MVRAAPPHYDLFTIMMVQHHVAFKHHTVHNYHHYIFFTIQIAEGSNWIMDWEDLRVLMDSQPKVIYYYFNFIPQKLATKNIYDIGGPG